MRRSDFKRAPRSPAQNLGTPAGVSTWRATAGEAVRLCVAALPLRRAAAFPSSQIPTHPQSQSLRRNPLSLRLPKRAAACASLGRQKERPRGRASGAARAPNHLLRAPPKKGENDSRPPSQGVQGPRQRNHHSALLSPLPSLLPPLSSPLSQLSSLLT